MGRDVIGIDIGGTYFRIGMADHDHHVKNFLKQKVGSVFSSSDPLGDLEQFLRGYIDRYASPEGIEAIVIGFPATLNRARTVVLQAPNVKFMENLPVVERLQSALNIRVLIERDVCLAVACDMYENNIPDCELLVGCYFGTGVGNVICMHRKPLLGKHGVSGELGHIPVDGSTELCGCGNRGCIENLAGGKYLAKLCQETYTDCGVGELFLKHGEEEPLITFVDRMAMAVATEVNILDPDYLLIGGGVPSMPGFPTERLVERIHDHTRKPYPEKDLQIIFTQDHEDKSVLGASLYVEWMAETK